MTEDRQRAAVIKEAETWLLTPYHHQGRVKGAGVDCATILLEVFSAVGIAENAYPEYAPEWHFHRSEEMYLGWMRRYTRQIEESELGIGDLIVWKFGRCFSHGSIYIGDSEVIHSYIGIGCTRSRMNESMFEGREKKFFSVWGK